MTIENTYSTEEREAELVAAAKSGCALAFEELHRLHAARLFRIVIKIVKSREDAEDVLQSAFLRAYCALHAYQGRSSFATWMHRITINSALMLLRKQRVHREYPLVHTGVDGEEWCLDWPDSAPDAEQILAAHHDEVLLLQAVKRLKPHLRDVLELHLNEGCSNREIAGRLGITELAAKSRRHRAWKGVLREKRVLENQTCAAAGWPPALPPYTVAAWQRSRRLLRHSHKSKGLEWLELA